MTRTSRTRIPRTFALTAGALALAAAATACTGGTGEEDTDAGADGEATPHGYVEGAEETAEPQPRLVVADEEGEAQVLDLVTEEATDLDPLPDPVSLSGDGRFAHLSDGERTRVVDTGVWTVDHGDHNHYYRAPVEDLGEVDMPGPVRSASDTDHSVLTGDDDTLVLDRSALEDGATETADAGTESEPGALLAPYEGFLVHAHEDGTVEVLDAEGGTAEELDETCEDPADSALTRSGLFLVCDGGALEVTGSDEGFSAEALPYPDGTDDGDRAESLGHRPFATTVAAPAGDDGVWVLESGSEGWNRHDLPDTVAATAIGEGGPVLALTGDGRLHALDPETGEERASTDLLAGVDPEHPPVVEADAGRTYVNDAEEGLVYEIDHDDDLRVARELETGPAPHFMVRTGY
ncbi:PQQ-binding-like beta-propeller repeat protein [Nocardiopsis sp. HNM0947]|uniref:PQQ-binding-like beta-propeller repeat protein n=1 Tax=Nocardiopsis coralli TaxID=2772213 RepID=A0ABR9P9Q5_9ACTN|nr:PQQ-binding-like beta-propeller repeat protein [Nocardiopsis coralli]MBE3000582.1 PQQ-binding-like beta-propeller repeat protein [Nocardiopsis coralli]